MAIKIQKIVGSWDKVTHLLCSQLYPDKIQFQEGRLYKGQKEPPGTFTIWDVGTYEIVDQNHIKISTANDAIVIYKFSIIDDVLTFVDQEGCELKYLRAR